MHKSEIIIIYFAQIRDVLLFIMHKSEMYHNLLYTNQGCIIIYHAQIRDVL